MSIQDFLLSESYVAEKKDMPISREVIERMAIEKPFQGITVVIGHFLALNSVALFEPFWRGGAEITVCTPLECEHSRSLVRELQSYGFPILPVEEAAKAGDYFVDNAGSLGKRRTPKGAVEVTRTGDWVYESLLCPTISIDKSRLKYLEDFLGTGESFVRGWYHLRSDDPLVGKNIVLFGYGKVGKGVAFFSRNEGANLTVVDINPDVLAKAQKEGFVAIDLQDKSQLKSTLQEANIVIGATGKPGAVGESVPNSWLRANSPFFVNIGLDEFGPHIRDNEILGGREVPLNFHLRRPTKNHKIDPIQAAEVLALEELVQNPGKYSNGLHPLPRRIDVWVLRKWISYWPEEDLSGIAEEIGLSELKSFHP
jgi:adenosylhomocysteinase